MCPPVTASLGSPFSRAEAADRKQRHEGPRGSSEHCHSGAGHGDGRRGGSHGRFHQGQSACRGGCHGWRTRTRCQGRRRDRSSRHWAGRSGQHGGRQAQRGRAGGPKRGRADDAGAELRDWGTPCGRVTAQLSPTVLRRRLRSLLARDQDGSSTLHSVPETNLQPRPVWPHVALQVTQCPLGNTLGRQHGLRTGHVRPE